MQCRSSRTESGFLGRRYRVPCLLAMGPSTVNSAGSGSEHWHNLIICNIWRLLANNNNNAYTCNVRNVGVITDYMTYNQVVPMVRVKSCWKSLSALRPVEETRCKRSLLVTTILMVRLAGCRHIIKNCQMCTCAPGV